MKTSDFKKRLAEEVHAGWRGFVNYILGEAEHLPDGSIKIKKAQVERWSRMKNSSYSKLRPNEKNWANGVVARVMKEFFLLKKRLKKKEKPDPRVAEIKEEFVQYCKNLRGFEPIIDHGRDGAMIKKRLENYTKDDILDCFDWFLTDKGLKDFSPNISTALSTAIFNKFLSKR